MKKLVEEIEGAGLESLLGGKVLLLCGNYFYTGKLIGVNDDCVLLEEPSIVYETGSWEASTYQDAQRLPSQEWYVQRAAIESYGVGK